MGVPFSWAPFGQRLSVVNWEELSLRRELESMMDRLSKLIELIQKDIEKIKELEKDTEKSTLTAMDNWIHSQCWLHNLIYKYVENCFENVCRLAYETSRSS